MDVAIQQATAADAEFVLSLQRIAYESEARMYNDWSIPPMTQTLDELIAEFEIAYFLKALLGTNIVGSVRGKLKGETCEVGRLIVSPAFQRKGLGRRLMGEIARAFPSARRFELFTGSRSEGNLRLYKSLGYREFKQHVLSEGVTLVFMEKAAP